jgi:hypothetical protein
MRRRFCTYSGNDARSSGGISVLKVMRRSRLSSMVTPMMLRSSESLLDEMHEIE